MNIPRIQFCIAKVGMPITSIRRFITVLLYVVECQCGWFSATT
jgi:hypothetical protein